MTGEGAGYGARVPPVGAKTVASRARVDIDYRTTPFNPSLIASDMGCYRQECCGR